METAMPEAGEDVEVEVALGPGDVPRGDGEGTGGEEDGRERDLLDVALNEALAVVAELARLDDGVGGVVLDEAVELEGVALGELEHAPAVDLGLVGAHAVARHELVEQLAGLAGREGREPHLVEALPEALGAGLLEGAGVDGGDDGGDRR